ncbi:MAG TPA: outer membrane protein transport protein [Salinivirgaceae bacterium]|nr:outer membrane protein transport protein [Salinivirgaceae bacterium]
MRKRKHFLTLLLLAITILPVGVNAEGYQLNLQHVRNTGMGHAGAGLFSGASSMHYNPGALGMMSSKMEFTAGGSLVFTSNVFQSTVSDYHAKTENPIGTPFYVYFAGKINDRIALGLGVNTPYGNTLKWEDNWAGRYLIEKISLKSITLLPTLSYKINDMFSIGAGVLYGINSVDLTKALPLGGSSGDGEINLKGTTNSIGFNAGIYAQINDKLSAGVSYRSLQRVKLDEGDVTLNVPTSLESMFPTDAKFNAELPFPSNLNVGVSYKLTEKLLLAVEVNFVGWSAYDSLNFDFTPNTPALQDSRNPRLYENTMIFRIGAEYEINKEIKARSGFYFDQTPTQDDYYSPETPGANKLGFAGGVSMNLFENFSFDFALLYIYSFEREAYYTPDNFGGKYHTTALIPNFGINYKF